MNEVSEATDMLDVPSVDQEWVVASCLVGSLLPIQPFSPAEGRLLAGVVACLGELPGEDQAKVWAMLTWHGGRVVPSLSPEVTHVILNLPLGQLYTAASSRLNIKIVTSDWVQQSVQTGSKCDEEVYHPRLLLIPENKPKERPNLNPNLNLNPQFPHRPPPQLPPQGLLPLRLQLQVPPVSQ